MDGFCRTSRRFAVVVGAIARFVGAQNSGIHVMTRIVILFFQNGQMSLNLVLRLYRIGEGVKLAPLVHKITFRRRFDGFVCVGGHGC